MCILGQQDDKAACSQMNGSSILVKISQQVIALSDRCLDAFYARFMGQVRPVLLEHSRQTGVVHGFTDNYIRVEIKCDPSQPDNVIVPVRLGGWNEAHDALTGEIVTNQPQMSE